MGFGAPPLEAASFPAEGKQAGGGSPEGSGGTTASGRAPRARAPRSRCEVGDRRIGSPRCNGSSNCNRSSNYHFPDRERLRRRVGRAGREGGKEDEQPGEERPRGSEGLKKRSSHQAELERSRFEPGEPMRQQHLKQSSQSRARSWERGRTEEAPRLSRRFPVPQSPGHGAGSTGSTVLEPNAPRAGWAGVGTPG